MCLYCTHKEIFVTFQAVRAILFWRGGLHIHQRRDSSRLQAGTRAHARICYRRVYVSLGRAHAHGAFSISRTLRWRSVQFVVVVVVVVAVVVDVVVVVVVVVVVLVLGAFFLNN